MRSLSCAATAPATWTKPRASGLGLSITHAIVLAHGGELSLLTGSRTGSSRGYKFRLPACPARPRLIRKRPWFFLVWFFSLRRRERLLRRCPSRRRNATASSDSRRHSNARDRRFGRASVRSFRKRDRLAALGAGDVLGKSVQTCSGHGALPLLVLMRSVMNEMGQDGCRKPNNSHQS